MLTSWHLNEKAARSVSKQGHRRRYGSTGLGLSVQWLGLHIDDIPTSQIEKQRYQQFWCKNGGKIVHDAYNRSQNFGLCAARN